MVEELVLDLRRELKMLTLLLAGMQEKFLQLELYGARPAERHRSLGVTNERSVRCRRSLN
jgi:hypothetical protein